MVNFSLFARCLGGDATNPSVILMEEFILAWLLFLVCKDAIKAIIKLDIIGLILSSITAAIFGIYMVRLIQNL